MTPLLKWAGGKRRLAQAICAHIGREYNHYYEPFLGGGAMLFHIAPEQAICSDINAELVNFYNVVKNNVEELHYEITHNYLPNHSKNFFYQIRALDRDAELFSQMTNVQHAARFIYLNKACYNGLWRVNQHGFNNVPWGRRDRLNIWDEENLVQVHNYLANQKIQILHQDYSVTARMAQANDLVYFDPPYDDERQAGFVDYSVNGFTRQNQIDLRDLCNELVDRGVTIAVSNADTTFIREIFNDARYNLYDDILAQRSIGSRAAYRQRVNEILIVSK